MGDRIERRAGEAPAAPAGPMHAAAPGDAPRPDDFSAFDDPRRAKLEAEALAARWPPERVEEALRVAATSGAPDAVLAHLARLAGPIARLDVWGLIEPLGRLFRASDLAGRILAGRPGLLRWLTRLEVGAPPKTVEVYSDELRTVLERLPGDDPDALGRQLRRYKYRELLRITWRDAVLSAQVHESGGELSALAECLVEAALSYLQRRAETRHGTPDPAGFCVIGMGKLGGEDLNFCSDIDLVYVYRGNGETRGAERSLSNVQHFTRLAEELTRTLSAIQDEGFCYRVDLNLRPQGRSGPLVMSLPAMLQYYEAYGRTWERSALLKARPVAGDFSLGEELLSELRPFIWRRTLDLQVVEALRELKARIDLRGRKSADDVKLGPGGIREIEFFASALQLLHGGKQPELRAGQTVMALRQLALAGLVPQTDVEALIAAYRFLRRLENHLQMREERQTQLLPTAIGDRGRLARSLDFADLAAFERELESHRSFVREAFDQLLGRARGEELPDQPETAVALDTDLDDAPRAEALEALGFAHPDATLATLDRLAKISGSPFAIGQTDRALLAIRLLGDASHTVAPDRAMFHLSELLSHLRSPAGLVRLLESSPRVRRRLLNLFGSSDLLSSIFTRHPELLDTLVQVQGHDVHKPPERLRVELAQRLTRAPDDPEVRLQVTRRYKNEELLRIGVHDIHEELEVPDVAAQLSAIAEAVLEETLHLAQGELRERYGEPEGAPAAQSLVVIAMGKLGGHELGYHSDLDLIFVYAGHRDDPTSGGTRGKTSRHELFARTAQRLITFLQMQFREGLLYRVDARLRPSGNQGALVVSEEAFLDHHRRKAQLWERQALVKARRAAGGQELWRRLQRTALVPLVYERPLPPNASQEIHRMRTRMERELAQETRERLDLKAGHGGLVDVEFATQYLQLRHGHRDPAIRSPSTLEALAALERYELLEPSDAEALRRGYLFHRRVENRLRLLHGQALSRLRTDDPGLARLARSLGYPGPHVARAFLDEHRAYAGRVREVYARLLDVH